MNELFRKQAIASQKARLYGAVVLNQPISLSLIIISILLMVSCFLTLLFYGSYARRETVKGFLVPDKGLIKIYAPIQGELSEIHINEAQKVQKNDLLFTVSTIKMNSAGTDSDTLLLNELEQQKQTFTEKIIQERLLSEAKVEATKQIISGIKTELSQLQNLIHTANDKLNYSNIELKKFNALYSNGYISEIKINEIRKTHLENKAILQTYKRQKIQLINRNNEYAAQLKQLPLQWKTRQTDLDANLFEIEQKIVEISGRRQYVIRAPVSGTLTALQISEGQTLNSQAPLIALLPEGSKLQAELFLPTRAAGFIAAEQNVLLRYEAFPYQHYGLHRGIVSNIAQVILSPSELPVPLQLNEPVYRVRVDIKSQHVNAYGKTFPLQAGMLLDADIVLAQRTLAEWLLEPIYGLSGKVL